jgi:DNA-binding NarL/FixJ family response regulator
MIMTGMPEITFINSAKKAGANSFIYKNVKSDMLLSTIRATMDGYRIFPNDSDSELLGGLSFTDTEIAILKLVCEAKGRKEIAGELAMSEGSVKAVISGILDKTGYDSILKFAVYAVSKGYIVPNV